MLASRSVNDNIILKRFGDYVASKAERSGYSGDRTARVDTLRFQIVPDPTVQEVALKSGDVDVIYSVDPRRAQELEKAGFQRSTAPGLTWAVFLMQTNDPVLSNLKVRQAIAHAINYDEIAEVRSAGTEKPGHSAVFTGQPLSFGEIRGVAAI